MKKLDKRSKESRELGLLLSKGKVSKDKLNDKQIILLVNLFLNVTAKHLANPRAEHLREFHQLILSRVENELVLDILTAMVGTDIVSNMLGTQSGLLWVDQIEAILRLLEQTFQYTQIRRDLNLRILEKTSAGHAPAHQF